MKTLVDKKRFPVGAAVIVKTCGGWYRGKICGYAQYGFERVIDAYNVTGDNIITKTREVFTDTGRKLPKENPCLSCAQKCCFRTD